MRTLTVGLAALMATALPAPVFSQEDPTEEIQETEQPGSEFELDIDDDGQVQFGRKGKLDAEEGGAGEGNPLELGESDTPLDPLDDPDIPADPDPIDEELPGEGPESLSGPDDDDPLPY